MSLQAFDSHIGLLGIDSSQVTLGFFMPECWNELVSSDEKCKSRTLINLGTPPLHSGSLQYLWT